MAAPSPPASVDDYTFDLQGFLELKGALSPAEVAALNAELDAIPPIANQQRHVRVHWHDYQRPTAEQAGQQDWGKNC